MCISKIQGNFIILIIKYKKIRRQLLVLLFLMKMGSVRTRNKFWETNLIKMRDLSLQDS